SPTIPPSPTTAPTVEPPTAEPATAVPESTAVPAPSGESPLGGADFTTFYEAWELITDEYDGALPPSDEVIQSAIAGSLETLDDDYTRYVPPAIAERMRQDMEGAVEGIGAFVQENDDGLFEIVRPIDGQPADLAGLKPGDVIIEVDGQSVLDMSFDEVILIVRGPEGTTVALKVAREGEAEPLAFTIVRTRFEVPVVEYEMLPAEITGGAAIGYIHLTEFNRNAEEKLLEALNALLPQQPVGLVFDLRDNPGGFLDQSVAVADAFLPDGVALFERNIRGLDQTFTTDNGDLAESIPLVVLVNAGSASASEIVAGAIQDRGRAVLVGETTFGKGSVQQVHTLSDGAELRVTVARWYTPDNHTIDGEGITPDFEVESPEDLGGVEDGQLRRAVEYLLTGQ
ncbi:S41 family peptidase, partial [Promineifilum sp.]|uniref:S41 family peptidase n=1 Tax=Promineifilum sp. TaxID=2664178 RepID=UPI0035B0768B